MVFFTGKGTREELGIEADHLAELVAKAESTVEIVEQIVINHELAFLIEGNATIVGQVGVIDGETAFSGDVEILLDRSGLMALRIERQREERHSEKQHHFSQIFSHNDKI